MASKQISSEWAAIITRHIRNPSGIWADYNVVHRQWRRIRNSTLFHPDDIPDEPDPADYPDTVSERTVR